MNLRVNLLHENERRYQGPVSLRLAVITAGSIVAAGIILLIGIAVQQHFSLRSNIANAQRDWSQIEPRFNRVTAKKKDLDANNALLGELALWTKVRPDWSHLLPKLQQIVPSTVQLEHLNTRVEWQYIKPPVPAADSFTEGSQPKEQPAVPARKTFVGIQGRAQGDLADETVVQFVKILREAGLYQPLFESLKLQSLTREPGSTDVQSDRLFDIQGEFFARKLE